MTEENAYDKFLQNYILYGMSDPNGLYTQYQQDYTNVDNQTSNYNNQASSNDDSYTKSGQNQQQGSYQQQNSYNNNSNNNYNNNRYNNNSNSGYRNKNNFTESQSGDTIIQRDTIFIQNLPKTVTVPELEQNFGSIGLIKIDKKTGNSKIWIYKDKTTGEGKGEATVTYDDEEAATAAINWFDNKEILGSIVKIQLATRKNNFNNFKGHRGGGGGYRGDHRGDRGHGGGNRFNDRRNNDRNERNYDRQNDRGDRNQGRGYHHSNRSNNNYSRPTPY